MDAIWTVINIGLGNGLLPEVTKPFTWTNVDLSSKVFCYTHLTPISQEVLNPWLNP